MRLESNATYIPYIRLAYPADGGLLLAVDENEPVYFQQETYARNREGTGDNRYQVLLIPRGNVLGKFVMDLGTAADFYMDGGDGKKYLAPPYFQPVLMEHTVAECRHMAEVSRMDDYALKLLHVQVNESDLFARYAQLIEEDMRLVKNRSTFGPHVRVERNGYSRAGARQQQERLAARGY